MAALMAAPGESWRKLAPAEASAAQSIEAEQL